MFQHVDQARILQLITQINSHKASGLDHISVKFAKSISQNIAYPLCKLFNQSFDVGKVPDQLKSAKIFPLFKGVLSINVEIIALYQFCQFLAKSWKNLSTNKSYVIWKLQIYLFTTNLDSDVVEVHHMLF